MNDIEWEIISIPVICLQKRHRNNKTTIQNFRNEVVVLPVFSRQPNIGLLNAEISSHK